MKKSNTSNKSSRSRMGKIKTCITCNTCNTFTTFSHGQSLFELVVAIAISALIIVAIVSLTTNSIQNSNFSKNKARAATFAQQAMEWLRGQRDSNVDMFFNTYATVSAYCLQDLVWTHPANNPATDCTTKINGTIFNRWVTFSGNWPAKEADITVSWTDSQGLHNVTSATILSDWRQR